MPGYITHNAFGRKEYRNISEGIVKEAIRKNINVFYVGLQGPDIFFYFPGYFLINKKNIGSIMHTSKTGEYMEKMLEYVLEMKNNNEKLVSIAYIAGFLGHYSLDRTCHPYIYWKTDVMHKTKNYHAKHVALETDIDFIMCKKIYKKNISEFQYRNMAKLSKAQRETLAKMLSYALKETYDNIRINYEIVYSALLSFSYIIGKIKDTNGKKGKIVKKLENKLIGHEHFSTLFIGDGYRIKNVDPMNLTNSEWFNPWNSEVKEHTNFYELMEKASIIYQKTIKLFENLLEYSDEKCAGCNKYITTSKKKFVEALENRSFLSNLTLE
jgi:hypothetical protein